jgi:transcriptional regulator with XRE-family HTH domain
MHTNLDQIVLALLDARRGDWQAVATASGVSYSWLSKFSNGHIENPGFETLKKLHAELTKVTPATATEGQAHA